MYCRKDKVFIDSTGERDHAAAAALLLDHSPTPKIMHSRALVQCIQHKVNFRSHEPELFFLKAAVEVQVVKIFFLYYILLVIIHMVCG
jgi:hypothetical protein